VLLASGLYAAQPYYDRTHDSRVFGEKRTYRIFLPSDYETSGKSYPVVYYFHGHSDRYTVERYDDGHDTVPKIADFVAHHDLIVVAVDGYVARDYTGFYGGFPYDVRGDGGDYDFGEYFLELVKHIDSTYRTWTDRRRRATSGLSMGGFMSLYLGARYPDRIGSASAFNPGPEFYVGEKDRRSLWRPKDHVLNHQQTMIRLVRASGDYISQYHEETREAYAHTPVVNFEFRQDEYHRHWATSIGETLAFHMRAFANPALDVTPADWNYTSAYRVFNAWGYQVSTDASGPAFVSLQHVTQNGFELTTRAWAPDGPAATCRAIDLQTAPLYKPGANYLVTDLAIPTGVVQRREIVAASDGHLHIQEDCSGHIVSFSGPGAGASSPALLPVTSKDVLRLLPGKSVTIPIRIYNPRNIPIKDVRIGLSSEYPTVEIVRGTAFQQQLSPGQVADLTPSFALRFVANNDGFARANVDLKLNYDGDRKRRKQSTSWLRPTRFPSLPLLQFSTAEPRPFPSFDRRAIRAAENPFHELSPKVLAMEMECWSLASRPRCGSV
jgi:predicted alpha/beta superfamily hydrolase